MSKETVSHVVSDEKPPPGERVIVFCNGFRCLGYRDCHDHWHNAFKGSELTEVAGWIRCNLIETTLVDLNANRFPDVARDGDFLTFTFLSSRRKGRGA